MTDKQKAINENPLPIVQKLVATVSADPDVTQQTLDDVKAGIPARDAEIEALRKEIETLRAAQEQPEIRECANGECGWIGTTDRMCGSVGPLCPDCGETTEAKAQQPVSGADATVKESLMVDERAAFEWWASDDGENPRAVERSGHGYELAQIQGYWVAWQARAALARQEEKQ